MFISAEARNIFSKSPTNFTWKDCKLQLHFKDFVILCNEITFGCYSCTFWNRNGHSQNLIFFIALQHCHLSRILRGLNIRKEKVKTHWASGSLAGPSCAYYNNFCMNNLLIPREYLICCFTIFQFWSIVSKLIVDLTLGREIPSFLLFRWVSLLRSLVNADKFIS